jgi:signal transduction histidine kinase
MEKHENSLRKVGPGDAGIPWYLVVAFFLLAVGIIAAGILHVRGERRLLIQASSSELPAIAAMAFEHEVVIAILAIAMIAVVGLVAIILWRRKLVALLRAQDEALAKVNAELEIKVGQRTQGLLEANERLEEANAQLRKEMQERIEAEAALCRTQVELAEGKRLSDIGKLAATVAHELRNPLGVIHMASYNIRKRGCGPEYEKYLHNIDRKVEESDRIISNLLSYARVRMPSYETFEVAALLRECVVHAREQFGERAVTIEERLEPAQGLTLEADAVQLREVVVNLLNNAYQALANEDRRIRVEALPKERDRVLIRVIDHGVGIDGEDLARIREPFFTKKSKGMGLGLTVCQEIVRLHRGSLEIESEKGRGTTVTVELPMSRNHT